MKCSSATTISKIALEANPTKPHLCSLHVVVNTRLLLPHGLDGIGWFTHEVLQRITQELSDWQFTFLFDRPFDDRFIYGDNVKGVVLPPPARHPLLYIAYFEWSVANYLNKTKPDFFFSPDGFLSLRAGVPQLAVIHDINFEHRPKDLPWAYRKYYRYFFPRFARLAKHIITVSEYSRQDIHKSYDVDLDKISVAYNGANEQYRPLSDKEKTSAREQFAHGSAYWVFVGNFSSRKNIHGIIESYDGYRRKGGIKKLVLVGNPLWQYSEMKETLAQSPFSSDIIFAGHLSAKRLTLAMGGAFAMLFPSFFEGFGIPVVEAFRAGIPVITSNQTSLPEVAGDAAITVNPTNQEEITAAMFALEQDEKTRNERIKKGLIRGEKFSWAHTANKVKLAMFHMASRQR